MAGGKLTPRQKMINLMYLVFIAMLALNMSKEVLSAFGLMDTKFDDMSKSQDSQNDKLSQLLSMKAGESPAFADALNRSKEINKVTDNLYDFLGKVKTEDILSNFTPVNGVYPYEAMDKSTVDEKWFKGEGYSARGQEIVNKINDYRNNFKKALGNDVKYQPLIAKVDKLFNTDDVTNREGVKVKYLDYHFKGFPAIASVAYLTSMQSDLLAIENEAYNIFLGASYKEAASMKNFQAIVVLDKNAYFEGEKITGKVVLGRYDKNTVPTSFNGPGRIENGQAVISMTAGGVGEHAINGKFTFTEDGKSVPLDFKGMYVVVPRPKGANISADKMNVVYRGLPNPITVSMSGIPADKVKASAPGLSPSGGAGKYNLNPAQGTEVTVTASGTLPDGSTISDKKVFRIKNIPPPAGAIAGALSQKGSKSRLEVSEVSALLKDFLYDLNFQVTQFTLKAPGQPAVVVNGNRLDGRARAALARVTKGDVISISDIRSKVVGGANIVVPPASPATYEIQ